MTDMSIYNRPTRQNYSLMTYDIPGATTKPSIYEMKLVNRVRSGYDDGGRRGGEGDPEGLPQAYELERDLKLSQK